jgi:hypothetical protein
MWTSLGRPRARRQHGIRKLTTALAIASAAVAAAFTPAGSANAATPIPPADQAVWLVNQWTHQCATPATNLLTLQPVIVQDPCFTSGQLVKLIPTRQVYDAGAGRTVTLFEITESASGKCYDLPNYGGEPAGTRVGVYACNSLPWLDNQEWYFNLLGTYGGRTAYLVENFASDNLCLDVSGWASDGTDEAPGQALTIYTCGVPVWANGGWDDHLWWVE